MPSRKRGRCSVDLPFNIEPRRDERVGEDCDADSDQGRGPLLVIHVARLLGDAMTREPAKEMSD